MRLFSKKMQNDFLTTEQLSTHFEANFYSDSAGH